MYRDTTCFCTLIWYLCRIHLLAPAVFFTGSLGWVTHKVMLSANREGFPSPFPVWMPCISFSCLIFLARTSRWSVSRRNACLVLDLKGKTSNLSSLRSMSGKVSPRCSLPGWKEFLHFQFYSEVFFFNHRWALDFVKWSFQYLLRWCCHFNLSSVNIRYGINWISCCLTSLISWDKSHLGRVSKAFYVYAVGLILVVFRWTFLPLYSQEILVFFLCDVFSLVWVSGQCWQHKMHWEISPPLLLFWFWFGLVWTSVNSPLIIC